MDGVRYGMVGIFVWAGADASASADFAFLV
jgi:hypothetical protein